MPMTPDEIARRFDAPPWPRRLGAEYTGQDDAALRRTACGARLIAEHLAAWLCPLAALYGALTLDLWEIAHAMGCVERPFVLRPRAVRPLDDGVNMDFALSHSPLRIMVW